MTFFRSHVKPPILAPSEQRCADSGDVFVAGSSEQMTVFTPSPDSMLPHERLTASHLSPNIIPLAPGLSATGGGSVADDDLRVQSVYVAPAWQ